MHGEYYVAQFIWFTVYTKIGIGSSSFVTVEVVSKKMRGE
jgi:hypothetical protein